MVSLISFGPLSLLLLILSLLLWRTDLDCCMCSSKWQQKPAKRGTVLKAKRYEEPFWVYCRVLHSTHNAVLGSCQWCGWHITNKQLQKGTTEKDNWQAVKGSWTLHSMCAGQLKHRPTRRVLRSVPSLFRHVCSAGPVQNTVHHLIWKYYYNWLKLTSV